MSDEELHVLYGGPDFPSIDDQSKSLGEIVLKNLNKYGDLVVLVNAFTGEEITAKQILFQSIRLAECLQHLGVQENDVVGLCCENRFEFVITMFATLYLGAVIAPYNFTYNKDELNHAVTLSKPKIVFTSNNNAELVANIVAKCSFVEKIITFDKSSIHHALDYNELMANDKIKSNDDFHCQPLNMDTQTYIIGFTSGTTGLPKGYEWTQTNTLKSISNQSYITCDGKSVFNYGVLLSAIPWYHAYGMVTTFGMIVCGAKIVAMDKFEARVYMSAIPKYKVTTIYGVPLIISFLAKHPMVELYDLSTLQIIYNLVAPVQKEILDILSERIPTATIRNSFGLAESATLLTLQGNIYSSVGSVGCVLPGNWGKIIDIDSGITLGSNERGEMCFKGNIMKGYIGGFRKLTNRAIDKDGWLHTEDVGYYNNNHEWFILDRLKDIIRFKGFQVLPSQIESLLLNHPKIVDAAVVGLPDKDVGELTIAYVVKQMGADLTEENILNYIANKTSNANRLHGGVKFIDEIPKNATGKTLRRKLRELAIAKKE